MVIASIICIPLRRRRKSKKNIQSGHNPYSSESFQIDDAESLQFNLDIIRTATNDFSKDNKLGEGGFGAVYKGTLSTGKDIAVKRLSRGSRQGDLEFKNELILVAKLQHRNLVRLLGFCLEGKEKLLVYEFVPNSSLDRFVFDPVRRANLNWKVSYKIICGIARGLLYLHEDSSLRIIHRNMNTSNVLLDEEMTPKISDFGLAKLLSMDQTQDNTSTIVGTFGYMAPECVMHGHFSVKSDVYSYGVLILEMLTSQKNSNFRIGENVENLLSSAWKNLREGTFLNLIDPTMRNEGSMIEMMRCAHIALLCVQENAASRPTMASVVLMLSSQSVALPIPSEPAYLITRRPKSKKNIQMSVNSLVIEGGQEPNSSESFQMDDYKSLQFNFDTIRTAADDFSEDNKLGQGGFGAVYKGTLSNGKDIAVKRLSRGSRQGDLEFKNEVFLVAKLQHNNLVSLVGFCLEGIERLLLYDFMPNGSLDHFIFDPVKRAKLNWEIRHKIIGGIAQGLLHLHENSHLRIIHRDIKASNVLLDEQMTPKISDFGIAKLFSMDQTHDNTSRIMGTYGYIAPEYSVHGQFSVKSDVYSYGVLVLEILTGQRNSCFRVGENVEDFLSSTWRNWRDGTFQNLIDPTMRTDGSMTEMMRCVHIALVCVQENAASRPSMASVFLMLNSRSLTLPMPSEPAFFINS